jgi:hypothetical protein
LVQFEVKATVGNDHPHGPPLPPLAEVPLADLPFLRRETANQRP